MARCWARAVITWTGSFVAEATCRSCCWKDGGHIPKASGNMVLASMRDMVLAVAFSFICRLVVVVAWRFICGGLVGDDTDCVQADMITGCKHETLKRIWELDCRCSGQTSSKHSYWIFYVL